LSRTPFTAPMPKTPPPSRSATGSPGTNWSKKGFSVVSFQMLPALKHPRVYVSPRLPEDVVDLLA
jgi:hypothetical protein